MTKVLTLIFQSILISMVPTTMLSAHALFVETSPSGKTGVMHEVTIYYAEPHDGIKEPISEWWADVREFTLWLHYPDGSKQSLSTTAQHDQFKASFIPEKSGIYTLTISHTANQLAGTTQYIFSTSAQVIVGNQRASTTIEPVSPNQLVMAKNPHKLKKNKEVYLISYWDKTPHGESAISIYDPKGWQKTVQTQSRGSTSFVPHWGGKYIIERIHKEEVNDQPFEQSVTIHTTALMVR